ncbi:MAG TPA: hypothetical protein VGX68_07420 [Thermoanaerobaculia bacterium]|jgi:hypothetical protein|nr:hypothetical protein [Thermoanaerobaculia bacterium]
MIRIDWEDLAREVGSLSEQGEVGGTAYARRALIAILGDSEILSAVQVFIGAGPGSELVRNVLMFLKPRGAMEECFRIFRESQHAQERHLAMALLASIADRSAVRWLDEFLDDSDAVVQSWAARLLFELILEGEVEEAEVEEWVTKSERHPNHVVQEIAQQIREEYRTRREALNQK